MTLLDRLKNLFRGNGARNAAANTLFDRFIKWFNPTNIFTTLNANALASNETIFAAVSRLANSIGGMPIKLLDKNYRLITNHRVADMVMNQPNPNMSSMDF